MNIIRNLPTPIAGLALGSVALGNLLQQYSSSLQLLFNLLSLIIIVLLTIKFILGYDELKKEMVQKGLEQAKKFEWKKSVEMLEKIYEEI